VAEFSQIDRLVTDAAPPPDLAQAMVDADTSLMVAPI
jgi:DeoR/GlpR family transcriptional regulator of sugar metabolism